MPGAATGMSPLEFELPRRRRRIDVVLLAHDLIFLFEIKAGASSTSIGEPSGRLSSTALDFVTFTPAATSHIAPMPGCNKCESPSQVAKT